MRSFKIIITVLAAVGASMAAISGRVTDTSGTLPIEGAIVSLEKSGHTTTTDANGAFTVLVGSTGVDNHAGNSPRPSLSVTIYGGFLRINTLEKSRGQANIFDLSGKLISTVKFVVGAGMHSIALPHNKTGVHLYVVNIGNTTFRFEGNSVDGNVSVMTTNFAKTYGALAKQSKTAANINDVLTISKTGYLHYRVVVTSYDTSGIAVQTIASAGTVVDTDGNTYQTVKLGNQIWTTENLRTKSYRDGSPIPLATDSASWTTHGIPVLCYYNFTTNPDTITKLGAFYNWAALNPANAKNIAPSGWHVPTKAEWDTLQNYLVSMGYNWDGSTSGQINGLAKALSAKADWAVSTTTGAIGNDLTKNNRTGFSALPAGYVLPNGTFPVPDPISAYGLLSIGGYSAFWTSSEVTPGSPSYGAYECELYYRNNWLGTGAAGNEDLGYSVRLVKD
jgi:uncharacterized protein (TIGR02145 family)